MSTAIQGVDCQGIISTSIVEGSSDTSIKLTEKLAEIRAYASSTFSYPLKRALEALDDIYIECSEPDWDGYGAKPISINSIIEAKIFLKLMPSLFPVPQPLLEPSGEVGLEWYEGKRMVLAISFNGRNTITYAGLLGSNKIYGSAYFEGFIPSVIIDSLRYIYQ